MASRNPEMMASVSLLTSGSIVLIVAECGSGWVLVFWKVSVATSLLVSSLFPQLYFLSLPLPSPPFQFFCCQFLPHRQTDGRLNQKV